MSEPPAITLIAGPTASGKSALALKTARQTGSVILNADSQQLYADLRILSARPSSQDEAVAEHRVYGVADAAEAWSVGRWTRAITPLLDSCREARRPVLIVGGTGLYFRALTHGLADIPDVPADVRDAAAAVFDRDGEAILRGRLSEVDPASARSIGPGDRQRLVRAWAVWRATGRSLSDWKAATRPILEPGTYAQLLIEPEREALYAACDRRVDAMLAAGALDEVAALLARGLSPDLPAMKAVGVRELAAHLSGAVTLDQAAAMMKQATRNYAKRQLTWFRNQTPDWPRV